MKAIREEHNLSLEWMEHTVPARDEVSMELVWSPVLEVACKETLQLIDNRNFRKEVMIILKSKSNQPVKVSQKMHLPPLLLTYPLLHVSLTFLPEEPAQISYCRQDPAAEIADRSWQDNEKRGIRCCAAKEAHVCSSSASLQADMASDCSFASRCTGTSTSTGSSCREECIQDSTRRARIHITTASQS